MAGLVRFLREGTIWTTVHFVMTFVWIAIIPLMVGLNWWESLPFLALVSVYANAVSHWGAWQAARSEEQIVDE